MNTTQLANEYFKLREEMVVLVSNQKYELAALNRDSTRKVLDKLGYVKDGKYDNGRALDLYTTEALYVNQFLRSEKLSQILDDK